MSKMIVANWKMNVLPSESVNYVKEIEKIKTDNQIIILAPYIDLPYLRSDKLIFGSQNIHQKDFGSYTGEISALMLKDININYCMIGHYERRESFNENKGIIELKLRNAISKGMNVILCVNSLSTLADLLIGVKNYDRVTIAYEPDDYIGSNRIVPKEKIVEFINGAKDLTGNKSKVIYGGGINMSNLSTLKEITELDGILVGSNSINIEKFKEIVQNY
ncbi:MAG: triosephosphate isomerase [Bacilli bacterium]|nr:triosephosphate isomerase [Bacilli bacterium]